MDDGGSVRGAKSDRREDSACSFYYVVALLAIAGAVILRRRHGPWLVLLAPLALVLFVSITAYGFTRFRVGAEPALIVLAAVTLDALVGRWRPERATGPEKSTAVPAAA